jgi:hypothetical protein
MPPTNPPPTPDATPTPGATAPLECIICGVKGPHHPVDADHPGWLFPKCYADVREQPTPGAGGAGEYERVPLVAEIRAALARGPAAGETTDGGGED